LATGKDKSPAGKAQGALELLPPKQCILSTPVVRLIALTLYVPVCHWEPFPTQLLVLFKYPFPGPRFPNSKKSKPETPGIIDVVIKTNVRNKNEENEKRSWFLVDSSVDGQDQFIDH
jgi:hypothetical protein